MKILALKGTWKGKGLDGFHNLTIHLWGISKGVGFGETFGLERSTFRIAVHISKHCIEHRGLVVDHWSLEVTRLFGSKVS